ncbi:NAD(P)/FAD-dependent oxidoreductase [Acidovorax lacteus]|uniref:Ferredoxin--NADP reductase n=1 Tax=Acidovorax lacteus TaxID=1924988 RepID=A0ABP8L5F4_9BURK
MRAEPSAPLTPAALPAQAEVLVIGAGPVGLFTVFQLGLQGLRAHLVDALPHTGGQCAELYGDKPIYDVPGVPVCTGRELVALLERQIAPMAPVRHLGRRVEALSPPETEGGAWQARLDDGTVLAARAVVIAAGVGAFVPRALKIEGIDTLPPDVLHYHDAPVPPDTAVVVHGGDDPAVLRALALTADPDHPPVVLLHRRDVFQAPPEALAALSAARAAGRIQVQVGQPLRIAAQGGAAVLTVLDAEGQEQALPLGRLEVRLGLSPRLGPIADWGIALERKQLVVDTARFATSAPGVYAVGDINTYPGKRKLILCGFHEATLAAFAVAERLSGAPVALQYTTTSPRLHQRLGVAPVVAAD